MPEPAHVARPFTAPDTGRSVRGSTPGLRPDPATLDVVPDGDRVSVAVRGGLDLDTAGLLQHGLQEALLRSTGGVDLELSAVDFFDCAALNVLLGLRRLATSQGKTIVIRASTLLIDRVLDLTGTGELFMPPRHEGIDAAHTEA